jgi:peptidoglycan/xylan/chitin deacetylase (PgdA/CDA1 family)
VSGTALPPAPDEQPVGLPARLRGAASGAGLLLGRRLRTPGAIVLAYHDVGDDPTNSTDYYVSPRLFRRQLELALRWGLRFVDLADLTDRFLAEQPVDGLAAIVFDDSLVGVHHHAMPLLVELGLPATVFTVTDELGRRPPWWPGAARVMTEAEVREMAALGFRIESHTRTHASLVEVRGERLRAEVAGSKHRLEDLLGRPVDMLAYPYGHHDAAALDVVRDVGYRAGYTFLNGRILIGMDPYQLPRLNMTPGQGLLRLAYHLARPPSSWPPTEHDAVGPR